MKSWLGYSILRILFFAVPLTVMLVGQVEPWIAGVLAAVIAFCLSYIVLGRRRDALVADLRNKRRAGRKTDDEVAEDEESQIAEARDEADAAAARSRAGEELGPTGSERDRGGETRTE